ncbi:hypothetical protein ABLE93_20840 [Xanthobacter sp. KR7-65]|uniref:hypothetical protein n=1 Tax=Xanthobacter sp. KR7-65 TaxID=3156612 RepID=UPI0032B32806
MVQRHSSDTRPYAPPPSRRLRIYAFDPSVGADLATAAINEAVVKVPWERDLGAGPMSEYFEVIDVDPASGAVYRPVDLDDPWLLAQDGLPPSEGNPMFHQQMVYAVAMTTVGHFEKALGRKILWSQRGLDGGFRPVKRLRIYPHALREANAYYSPAKKALLFGYFPASLEAPGRNLPGGMVFTCLSNDVVAHETTHAIVDGLHPRYIEPSNPDAPAFHEAFADIVALFQHFTMPEALSHQIARMRGDLGQRTLLSELAVQFGQAIGHYGALRSAIDTQPGSAAPDPTLYARTSEAHARGAILVAAVFDGFLAIYRNRIADLLRLVTGDGAKFPDQDLHPDLVGRLTAEANKAASHVLRMCIRALDYMPPVDPTFGEFLRALITADADLIADDTRAYRISMIEAFRRRGIYPADCRSLAADSLIWNAPHNAPELTCLDQLDLRYLEDRGAIARQSAANAARIHAWLMSLCEGSDTLAAPQGLLQLAEMGLALGPDTPATVRRRDGVPTVEVHAVRLARRTGPNQESLTQIVVEITQRRAGYFSPADQDKADAAKGAPSSDPGDFAFRGGCTLVIEPGAGDGAPGGVVRYCVRKRIDDDVRLARHRAYLLGDPAAAENAYRSNRVKDEPFALLHRCGGGGCHGF